MSDVGCRFLLNYLDSTPEDRRKPEFYISTWPERLHCWNMEQEWTGKISIIGLVGRTRKRRTQKLVEMLWLFYGWCLGHLKFGWIPQCFKTWNKSSMTVVSHNWRIICCINNSSKSHSPRRSTLYHVIIKLDYSALNQTQDLKTSLTETYFVFTWYFQLLDMNLIRILLVYFAVQVGPWWLC